MNPILDKIIRSRRQELRETKKTAPVSELRDRPLYAEPRRPFRDALRSAGWLAIIAELKKASPSKGLLREDFSVPDLCRDYYENGAAALSVLTEKNYFLGGLENLETARACCPLPLLRKDFIIDEYQMPEARAAGADCVLLIAAALPPQQLDGLAALARELGLETLVEIHGPEELDAALACGPDIIGVNNRDLKTFHSDIGVSLALAREIPPDTCKISESGLKDYSDLRMLSEAGFHGFLIGETLVTAPDPGAKLKELLGH